MLKQPREIEKYFATFMQNKVKEIQRLHFNLEENPMETCNHGMWNGIQSDEVLKNRP